MDQAETHEVAILSDTEDGLTDRHPTSLPAKFSPTAPMDSLQDFPPRMDSLDDISLSFSEDDLIPSQFDFGPLHDFSSRSYMAEYERESDVLYSKPVDDAVDSRITVQRTLFVSEPPEQSTTKVPTPPPPPQLDTEERKGRRTSRSLSSFGRRNKSAKRGAESPSKLQDDAAAAASSTQRPDEVSTRSASLRRSQSTKREKSRSRRNQAPDDQENSFKGAKAFLTRRSSKFSKKTQNAVNPAIDPTTSDTPPSSSPSKRPSTPVMKSSSSSNLTALSKKDLRTTAISPLPGTVLSRVRGKALNQLPKRNDELWSVFRSLESDFAKFEDKQVGQKASCVRTSLLPFLQNYSSHPANSNLSPEDLDRRVQILDKWWKGLLQILDPQSGQNVSGFDRLSIMDAVTGIMERPEWRESPSESAYVNQRSRSKSTASQRSDASYPSAESVIINTRHIFMHNLFRQMAVVVDKMSGRHAVSSLVTFCGKTCAFAFFFCPGMAEVLVRLWNVSSRNIKRAAESIGVNRVTSLAETSRTIVPSFPECTHALEFISCRAAVAALRAKPVLPLGFDKIDFKGPWLDRWCGKESDLFYVFMKQFHCLMIDFLPEQVTRRDLACVPGYVLLRAQLLTTLDSTFHRAERSASEDQRNGLLPSMFDMMPNADATLLAVPPMPPNASRLISENRLIMLLRNFLSQASPSDLPAQTLFADCVCDSMKAAACTTSLFDQIACLTVCDFLQEAFAILGKFENRTQTATALDWDFWLCCFAQMVRSDNTLTLIRVISLLFSAWPSLSANENRKGTLCFKFILDQDIFSLFFLHWCPMVRSYFMRLLAWRLARNDGDPTQVEVEIFKHLYERLLEVWAFFKYAVESHEVDGLAMPSTAPCNPAPGRRLLIIRTDTPAASNLLTDSSPNSESPSGTPRSEQNGANNSSNQGSSFSPAQLFEKLSATLEQGMDTGRRKSGLFRSITGSRSSENRAPTETLSDSPPVESSENKPDSALSSTAPSSRASLYEQRPLPPTEQTNRPKSGAGDKNTLREKASSIITRQAEFRFSMEPGDRRPHKLPREIALTPPRLPYAAYALLQSMPEFVEDAPPTKPDGISPNELRYTGRALAEWSMVVNECQNFFDRRRKEGIPTSAEVETPIMTSEPFRRYS